MDATAEGARWRDRIGGGHSGPSEGTALRRKRRRGSRFVLGETTWNLAHRRPPRRPLCAAVPSRPERSDIPSTDARTEDVVACTDGLPGVRPQHRARARELDGRSCHPRSDANASTRPRRRRLRARHRQGIPLAVGTSVTSDALALRAPHAEREHRKARQPRQGRRQVRGRT